LLVTKLLHNTTCSSQTDGKTEVTNRTLSALLRTLVQKNLKEWDLKLPHAKFAHNKTAAIAAGCSLFEALYRINPLTLIDLIPLPVHCKVSFEAEKGAKEMKKLHEHIRAHIEKVNEAYKIKANKNKKGVEYQRGDLAWLHLRKERFPTRRKSKLMLRRDRPFKVLAKVGASVYKLEFSEDMAISATFNVDDLSPYVEDKINYGDLRANPFEGREDDVGHTPVQGL